MSLMILEQVLQHRLLSCETEDEINDAYDEYYNACDDKYERDRDVEDDE